MTGVGRVPLTVMFHVKHRAGPVPAGATMPAQDPSTRAITL